MLRCERTDDISELEKIYREHMKKDFPPSELKPFAMIKKEIVKGEYVCYGLFSEDALLGYAFLAAENTDSGIKNYLLDYFAVVKNERGKGRGSGFIKMLAEEISINGIFICEAENPQYAENDEDRSTRQRRVDFYLRNGFIHTGVTARLFGVEYVILEIPKGKKHTEDEIKRFYSDIYGRIVPKMLLKRNLTIH